MKINKKDNSKMILIPEGLFLYGSEISDEKSFIDERPQRIANLPDFYIDKYPMTNKQFCLFLNQVAPPLQVLTAWIDLNASNEFEKCRIYRKQKKYFVEKGYGSYPVDFVSYCGAGQYAEWAGKRLPLEQEWEKAARGVAGRIYPWGNKFKKELCNTLESGFKKITPVTQFVEGFSPYGCVDMCGNVREWTSSYFDKYKVLITVRGGSYYDGEISCRCAFCIGVNPSYGYFLGGFRCCRP